MFVSRYYIFVNSLMCPRPLSPPFPLSPPPLCPAILLPFSIYPARAGCWLAASPAPCQRARPSARVPLFYRPSSPMSKREGGHTHGGDCSTGGHARGGAGGARLLRSCMNYMRVPGI